MSDQETPSRRTGPPVTGFRHEQAGGPVEYYTPPEVFAALGLRFDLDPAAPPGGVPWVPARRYYTAAEDGLAQPWRGRVWLNPPYNRRVGRWLGRLAEHGDGMALVFARTDTRWWQTVTPGATAVCLVAGRIRFRTPDGSVGPAPASSALLAFGLPCALAVAAAGLGQTLIVPQRDRAASPPQRIHGAGRPGGSSIDPD